MNSSPATELPTARGLVDAPPIPMAGPPSSGVVFPVVLVISLLAHGAVFAAAVAVPHTRFEIAPAPVELAFEVVAPAPAAPEPAPLPEPVPEVAPEVAPEPPRVAAAPTPRRERAVADVEPAPAPPVLTAAAGAAGGADWATDPGEEGGSLGGQRGGTGTGLATAAPQVALEPARTGPSRAELRARVMAYIRGLSGSLTGRVGYPLVARREHLEGVVVLHLRVAADGRVLSVRMARSSGHGVLDDAALASVTSVASLPAPPEGVPWDDGRELPVPIRFEIR